jgi:hypothetical protein
MKHTIVLLTLLIVMSSCARKVAVRDPVIIRAGRYLYIKDDKGRVYIVTTNTKDFDEAMKAIRPGPASVNKLDLWVVTPAPSVSKEAHR